MAKTIKSFKTSQTYKNLQNAFAGESQAANKYRYYSAKAKKDGFVYLSKVFEESSNNEVEHAKIWFKLISGEGDVSASIPSTLTNLKDAIAGEKHEWSAMYPSFAKTAVAEGYPAIASLFSAVAQIEKFHEQRYKQFEAQLKAKKSFVNPSETYWFCLNCGMLIKAKTAPIVCPVCRHKQSYFVRKDVTIA